MSHNPRIKNNLNGTTTISGTVKFATPATITVNKIKTNVLTSSFTSVSSLSSSTAQKNTVFSGSGLATAINKVTSDLNLEGYGHTVLADASNNQISVYLPDAFNTLGQEYVIKKTDSTANPVYIKSNYVGQRFESAILSGSKAIDASDYFGNCIAINSAGDKIVVGAYADESGSTSATGLAYVFDSGSIGWTQSAILSGSKAIQASDSFGYSVAVNSTGDKIIVGAYADESGSITSTGLVYVFSSGSTGWTETAILSGSKAIDASDNFGYSVALNSTGNIAVIGAYADESGSTTSTGLAYVFSSGSTGWTQSAILSGSKAIDSGDNFGYSVAVNSTGDKIIVGAYNDESGSTLGTGLAYVFDSGSIGWTQSAILSGSKAIQASDYFGISVAVNSTGDKIIVGAYNDESGSTLGTGLAYVFSSGSTGWTETAILSGSKAIDASDNFGYSVALNSTGNIAVIGAYADESGSTTSTGLAYVFSSGSTGWTETAVLSGSKAIETYDSFGISVALNSTGDKIIVGAYADEPGATTNTGLAYVFITSSQVDNIALQSQNSTAKLISDGKQNWKRIL